MLWTGESISAIGNAMAVVGIPLLAVPVLQASTFIAVGDGICAALRDRPTTLRRFPDGIEGEAFFQKRVPPGAPDRVQKVKDPVPAAGPPRKSGDRLDALLELADVDDRDRGLGDMPYQPEYPEMPGEPKRAQPHRARPSG